MSAEPLSESTRRASEGAAPLPINTGGSGATAMGERRVPRIKKRDAEQVWLTPGRLLALVAVVVASYAMVTVVVALRTVLVMLLVALFLSFAMEPAVQWLARHGWRRGAATGAVFALALLLVAALVAAMLPPLIAQFSGLVGSLPSSIEDLTAMLPQSGPIAGLAEGAGLTDIPELNLDLNAQLRRIALGAAGNVVSVGRTAAGVLFQLLTIGLLAFYLTADGPRARQVLARPLPPDRQREMLAVWELAVAKTGGYIYSRLLLAGICAASTVVFLLWLGVSYPIPLGLYVGATSAFVPVVGTYLGGVLLLLVAFVQEPVYALYVGIYVLVYQQVENYVLAPRIQSRTMDIHPAVAFVSVLVGGTLLGAVGALLALPVTAILQALMSTYVRRHKLIEELADIGLTPETAAHMGDPDELRAAQREDARL